MAKLCLREHFQFLHCVTSSASTFHHFDLHFSNSTPVSKFQATKGGSKSSLYRVDLNESGICSSSIREAPVSKF